MSKFTQEDLDKVLDKLHEGVIGTRKEGHWDSSWLRTGNKSMTSHLNSEAANAKRRATMNAPGHINKGGASRRSFTVEQVLDIKKRYSEDISLSAAAIADEYNVSIATITLLLDGQSYPEPKYGPPVEVRKSPTLTCPHCNLSMESTMNYKKWHGDMCKEAPGYVEPEYEVKKHFPIWRELSTGFEGTSKQMEDRFPHINMPSMMNSDRLGIPLRKGKNKGLHFKKLS